MSGTSIAVMSWIRLRLSAAESRSASRRDSGISVLRISVFVYGELRVLSLSRNGAVKLSASGKSGNQPMPKTSYSPFSSAGRNLSQGWPSMATSKRPLSLSCFCRTSNSCLVAAP